MYPWDEPEGICSGCGAPLNEYMVGGYRLHDGTYAVPASIVCKTIDDATFKVIRRILEELVDAAQAS